MWLKQLKIAIVEQNIDKMDELMDNLPQLNEKKDIQSAIILIAQAKDIVEKMRDKTQSSMLQMKKNIDFLNSTQLKPTSKFDIRL